MMVLGPPWGYFPQLNMSILIVSPRNFQREEEYFTSTGVCMVNGSHHIGGFISDPLSEKVWLDDKVKDVRTRLKCCLGWRVNICR